MSRLDGFFRKAEQAASDLVEAVRFGIFGPPRRRELAVERMRIAGPADTEALRRALVESHRFLFPMQEKHMATKPHRPDPGTAETVLISTPDVSRVMARIRAIAMGNPRETDVDGKPLPPLDLAVLVLMLGSDLLNLREVHGTLQAEVAGLNERLARTTEERDRYLNDLIATLQAEVAGLNERLARTAEGAMR